MQTFLFDFRALELVTQKCWERKPTMNLQILKSVISLLTIKLHPSEKTLDKKRNICILIFAVS